ncbi:helix-turn-helix domain-containing protein [Geomonas sp. Red32]|uniref:helix-turn-helix domain-containing protein n=1 Tax=Geomonas sp. Red32 TaxID=2912856 RepID=UPI00202CF1E9|nr:helix-turn-helix domain-containing protein [Geomonas sp. Red32]MCM0081816.1 helix-turn-helix domain-containing protein [Geomonas sp. Red32]
MSSERGPKKASSRREWFKYEIRTKGSSFSKIASSLEISRAAVTAGIERPSTRLADAVATVLGREKSELWPERFQGRKRSIKRG